MDNITDIEERGSEIAVYFVSGRVRVFEDADTLRAWLEEAKAPAVRAGAETGLGAAS